jgi:hypothetical protein
MVKIDFRVSEDLYDLLILSPSFKLLGKSEFIRQALSEKLEREDIDFLFKRKKELKHDLQIIESLEKDLLNKKEDQSKLPEKEIIFLLNAKQKIELHPENVGGLIRKYIFEFQKKYKVTLADFYLLIDKADELDTKNNVLENIKKEKEKEKQNELSELEKRELNQGSEFLIKIENNGLKNKLQRCSNIDNFRNLQKEMENHGVKIDISSLQKARKFLFYEKSKENKLMKIKA